MCSDQPLGPVSNQEYRKLAVAFVDIVESVRRASHDVTGYEPLPSGVIDILRVIERNPGITVAEVASRLDRQCSNVSTQLKDLVARGLVTRSRDGTDKRYVALHATAEAHRIKALLESSWEEALAAAGRRLPPAEQSQLRSVLPTLLHLTSVINED